MTQSEIRTVILAMSALIALNIFATIVFEIGKMEVMREIAEGAARDIVMFRALAQIEKDSERVADELVPEIVDQWRGNFRSAFGSANQLGLGQYQTKDKTPVKKQSRNISMWPFHRSGNIPASETELVPVDSRVNGNGAKPPEENPT